MDQPERLLLLWKDDIRLVRELYQDRKYRKCAISCAEVLKRSDHALLRTFLYFYQAISYESLGHISHDRSNNKIPLLEQARDALISANESLTSLTGSTGRYGLLQTSPIGELLNLYQYTPTRGYPVEGANKPNLATSIFCSSIARVPEEESTVHDSSQVDRVNNIDDVCDKLPGSRASKKASVKARLSRSLSSQHALADELVPSPLFNRTLGSKKQIEIHEDADATPLPLVSLSKPLPPVPIDLRPLPLLPFNTNAEFVLKGKRLIVVPRKTALATLISKFEPHNPFDSPSTIVSGPLSLTHTAKTPVTERFRNISAVFADKDEDKENVITEEQATIDFEHSRAVVRSRPVDPVTPCPASRLLKNHTHTTTTPEDTGDCPSPPVSSELLADLLVSVRSSLVKHIATVNNKIDQIRTLQKAHEEEKRRQFATMHSRNWSLIPDSSSTPASPSKSKVRNRESQPTPAKDTRLRSFWNLQIADAQSKSTDAQDEKKKAQKERIERLKKNGWRDVRKEAKGFKGAAYYEGLRKSIEQEMCSYA